MKNIAIVLAAGQGKRMGTKQKKQYLQLENRPILYYSLKTFDQSPMITDIVIVVGAGEEAYVQESIVDAYQLGKVRSIVPGGKERYHSVSAGIQSVSEWMENQQEECYIYVHDGARPFINEEMLERVSSQVKEKKACVVGMPVKDTIKIADALGYVQSTPNRNMVWQIQTPQVFSYELIKQAYEQLMVEQENLSEKGIQITDDAMVVETFSKQKIALVEGDYKNIKITTPEDLQIAQIFLRDFA